MTLTADASILLATVELMPDEGTATGAAFDALQESWLKPQTARRLVNRAVRRGRFVATTASVNAKTKSGGKARTAIRAAVQLGTNTSVPVTVVDGDQPPAVSGEASHHTFKNGSRVRNAGAAIRAGYKVVYHASTLAIVVGSQWVERNV